MNDRHGDEQWMALALDVAGRGSPAPNPKVGALVVASGKVAALGWHEVAGGPHAEVVALRGAGELARGATLYVTLEPCNHYGRTPPCVDAIVAARLRRVVVGCLDPNPFVVGGGVAHLRSCGVTVDVDVLRAAALELISSWTPRERVVSVAT